MASSTEATTTNQHSAALRAALTGDGFVLIPEAFPQEDIDTFRVAARNATELARAGKWPYVRTLPKQFPPWTEDITNGIWGVQHLLHPDMPERKIFASSYFNNTMLNTITGLLQCQPSDLVLELYNMLIRPDRDFALRWHRDDIPPETPPEDELIRLQEPMLHAQWNLALYPDASLVVIPGSHKRARTEMERHADPYEDDMPGQKIVKMEPGDILFYNNNILHRGVYDCKNERMTLHGTMGVAGTDKARARNILQHGIGSWGADADFSDLPPDVAAQAEGMKERLIALGRQADDVGYSQAD